MSHAFTKLFASITDSSIWAQDDHTRLVWITMLAMADKNGEILAAVPGLANRARVPMEACEKALEKFLGPDTYSRSKENEGRRIEVIDGGWRLLNYEKYREIQSTEAERERKREWARRKRSEKSLRVDASSENRRQSTQAEAEAEAEADKEKNPPSACATAETSNGLQPGDRLPNGGIIPTIGQVKAWGATLAPPVPENVCEAYYSNRMASEWRTEHKQLKPCQHDLNNFWLNWRDRESRAGPKRANPTGNTLKNYDPNFQTAPRI